MSNMRIQACILVVLTLIVCSSTITAEEASDGGDKLVLIATDHLLFKQLLLKSDNGRNPFSFCWVSNSLFAILESTVDKHTIVYIYDDASNILIEKTEVSGYCSIVKDEKENKIYIYDRTPIKTGGKSYNSIIKTFDISINSFIENVDIMDKGKIGEMNVKQSSYVSTDRTRTESKVRKEWLKLSPKFKYLLPMWNTFAEIGSHIIFTNAYESYSDELGRMPSMDSEWPLSVVCNKEGIIEYCLPSIRGFYDGMRDWDGFDPYYILSPDGSRLAVMGQTSDTFSKEELSVSSFNSSIVIYDINPEKIDITKHKAVLFDEGLGRVSKSEVCDLSAFSVTRDTLYLYGKKLTFKYTESRALSMDKRPVLLNSKYGLIISNHTYTIHGIEYYRALVYVEGLIRFKEYYIKTTEVVLDDIIKLK